VEPESTLEIFRGGTRVGLETNLGEDQGRDVVSKRMDWIEGTWRLKDAKFLRDVGYSKFHKFQAAYSGLPLNSVWETN
jgi:hypothetical protein